MNDSNLLLFCYFCRGLALTLLLYDEAYSRQILFFRADELEKRISRAEEDKDIIKNDISKAINALEAKKFENQNQ